LCFSTNKVSVVRLEKNIFFILVFLVWEEFARYFCFCFILRAEGKGKKNDIEMFHEPKTNLMKHKKKKIFLRNGGSSSSQFNWRNPL